MGRKAQTIYVHVCVCTCVEGVGIKEVNERGSFFLFYTRERFFKYSFHVMMTRISELT